MGRVLDVSLSGFYAYRRRPLAWRRVIDHVLMAHVRIAFAESGETYGAPRLLHELQAEGLPTSQKRVARLMREAGLRARPRRSRRGCRPRIPITPSRSRRTWSPDGSM
jgi:transposase InsO family protein